MTVLWGADILTEEQLCRKHFQAQGHHSYNIIRLNADKNWRSCEISQHSFSVNNFWLGSVWHFHAVGNIGEEEWMQLKPRKAHDIAPTNREVLRASKQ